METEKKRTLKGSILFTVVSVLALMTIFMTSALALAAAANKRAHKTYSASQASYTARAAIDSVLAAVGTNNEFAKAVESLPQNGKFDVDVGINSPSLGKIDSATVEYAGKTTIFDPNTKAWVEKNLIRITAEVTMGGETTKLVSHVIQDPVVKSEDGPGFLTMGGGTNDIENHSSVFGGSYYGMGYGYNGGTWNGGLTYIDWNPYGGKLTALDDKEYLTNKTFHHQNDTIIEAPFVVNGNFSNETVMHLHYTQLGKGAEVWGNMYFGNTSFYIHVSPELKDQIAASSKKFNQMPYLYVDQKFCNYNIDKDSGLPTGGHAIAIGDGSYPFNIFCGSYDFRGNGPQIRADIYCMDKEATSYYSSNGSTLYNWSDSLLNGGSGYNSNGGSIYSKGNLSFDSDAAKINVQGSVKAEGNVDINRPVAIDGDLVVGGKLSIGTDGLTVSGNIYAGSCEGTNVSIVGAGELKDGYHIADVNYVIGKDVFIGTEADTAVYYPYIWLNPDVLKDYNGYYSSIADSNAFDFDNLTIDPKYLPKDFNEVEGLEAPADWGQPDGPGYDAEHPDTPKEFVPDLNQVRKCRDGYFNAENKEVLETEAVSTGGIKYGSKDVYPLSEYYKSASSIYPDYADRSVILGLSGPVKGTEGHFGDNSSIPSAVYNRTYNGTAQLVGHVTESCTLTGTFTKPVTVDANGADVYVLISDASFRNDDDPTQARIYVNEANGGKVYFFFDGEVECFYDNPSEKEESQIIQTVFEVMTTWGIEKNVQSPQGEIANVVTSANALNDKITIDSVDAKLTGEFNGTTITIIPPATGSIWVQLDNFQGINNAKIIINDVGADKSQIGGTVNFYVTGTNNSMNGGKIVTQSFIDFADSNEIVQVVSDLNNPAIRVKDPSTGKDYPFLKAPRVNMYSEQGAKLSGANGFFISAFVRAPFMDLDLGENNFTEDYDKCFKRIYYDGVLLSESKGGNEPKRLGVVGCLNVKSQKSQNDWFLLYVKDADDAGSILDANKQHTYAAVSYMEY